MSLNIDAIRKAFGGTTVLNGASLHVAPGEFVALLGPSGSGKTTLLNIVAGLVHPDGGALRLDGEDITDLPAGRRRFGVVFQSYALFRHMTVRDNVSFGLRVRPRSERLPRAAIERRTDELLELIGLPDLGARYPTQLSGGQRQRVATARALAIEPRLLLMDEPFSALDAKVRRELRGSVRDIQRRAGVAAIMVTHDESEAYEIADRVALMDAGRIVRIERVRQPAQAEAPNNTTGPYDRRWPEDRIFVAPNAA